MAPLSIYFTSLINNGDFLAQVEFAKYNPVTTEQLWRIQDKEYFDIYIGKEIQNEMTGLI